ncbi:hypothetical protein QYE76_051516 [Lolium multiflorum]|uniref:DDE Tnp4 domain-containing protein n=1 Tax=Lolium multiflorum TaxID=4521 RepID=A0AAD8SS08_LOLMU|nr:hypothetical protein QYE76_051516 [Lolium multiflorum]
MEMAVVSMEKLPGHSPSRRRARDLSPDLGFVMAAAREDTFGDAGYACRPGILPPFRKTRYHLNEFSAKHRPLNARELFNLRHSSLRVTIERAFAALKNRFKVLDQKPFHTFDTQVKLVLACCILHNWILGWGEDEFFEEVVTFDEVETGHGVDAGDNDAWKVKRQEWADAMWEVRGNTTI